MVAVDEEVLAKTGPELFKELFKVYPVAEVDDYYKGGIWKDDIMRLDLQLLLRHRREAGADDPEPFDETKLPKLPPAISAGVGIRAPVAAVRPLMPAAASPVAGGAVSTVAAAELRLIALFVAKWGLDAARTKAKIDRLPVQRRRYVLQNFKSQGPDPNGNLDKYIASCEATGIWGTVTNFTPAVRPVAVAASQPRPMTTMMRPATAQQRPMMIPQRPAGMGMSMPVRAAVRPVAAVRAATGVRPANMMAAGSVPVKRPLQGMMTSPVYDPSKRPRPVTAKAFGAASGLRPGLRPSIIPGMARH